MIVGIDLGTTNSLVSVWRNGQIELIPNALGQTLTPSVVGLDDQGQVLVGQAARDRLITHPQNTAANFKRYMGSNHTQQLGMRSFRAEELSALVLKALKADAEAYLCEAVSDAVITVPAYFNDTQRKATKLAGELAGLKVERLLNEPTAAAMAYGLHQNQERKLLVFDLGGGTFDVSILDMFEGVMEVRASAGDNQLGGEDFNDLLLQHFIAQAPALAKAELNPVLLAQLRKLAESAKRQLSEHESITVDFAWGEQQWTWPLTQAWLEEQAAGLLARLRSPVERALRDARLRASELDEIVLVGGSTRMPLVRKLVTRMFGRFPVCQLNPDEVVVMGAAVQAGLQACDAALDEIVLTDVSPYSLGVEVTSQLAPNRHEDGVFLPIIERNTLVPVSRCKQVFTLSDLQKVVLVRIFQGEARKVKDNVFLGELKIEVPPLPAGEVNLDVRFTYTVDGILEAECTVANTGEVRRLVIEQSPGALSESEVAERLKALNSLKMHPRDRMENTVLLTRANRLFEQTSGELRQFIGQQIGLFECELDSQDSEQIKSARKDLHKLLDDIEGESWL